MQVLVRSKFALSPWQLFSACMEVRPARRFHPGWSLPCVWLRGSGHAANLHCCSCAVPAACAQHRLWHSAPAVMLQKRASHVYKAG